jgi:predicted negative regulator of RcsB-dependent stress response
MKSEHRHELKSNELAEWLNNSPQWFKENFSTILIVVAAIVVVGLFFGWRYYSKDIVQAGEQEQFTSMIDNILHAKTEVVSQQVSSQASDMSYLLGKKAEEMKALAQSTGNKDMAALALVKAADSIRSELHFSNETVSKNDLTKKINEAQSLYNEAIGKSPSDNTIMALAKFGLGLCEEELGNFEEAGKIYKSILDNASYKGTVVIDQVSLRLNTMSDYKKEVVFLPAPPPVTPDANSVLDPLIQQLRNAQNKAIDANKPLDTNLPVGTDIQLENGDAKATPANIQPNIAIMPNEANLPKDVNSPN